LASQGVVSSAKTAKATVGGKSQAVTLTNGVITFSGGLALAKGSSLTITLAGGAHLVDMAGASASCDATTRYRQGSSAARGARSQRACMPACMQQMRPAPPPRPSPGCDAATPPRCY
jgi:hypothetical protein